MREKVAFGAAASPGLRFATPEDDERKGTGPFDSTPAADEGPAVDQGVRGREREPAAAAGGRHRY